MSKKLYIYDAGSRADRDAAAIRFSENEVTTIAARNTTEIKAHLDMLVREGLSFDRVLWQTHGGYGHIAFNNDSGAEKLYAKNMKSLFGNTGHHKLFPAWTKMIFDGCAVGYGDSGLEFMRAAGSVFLKSGGVVIAYTTLGDSVTGWGWRLIGRGGHTIHPRWTDRRVYFARGGKEVPASKVPGATAPWDDSGRPHRAPWDM